MLAPNVGRDDVEDARAMHDQESLGGSERDDLTMRICVRQTDRLIVERRARIADDGIAVFEAYSRQTGAERLPVCASRSAEAGGARHPPVGSRTNLLIVDERSTVATFVRNC